MGSESLSRDEEKRGVRVYSSFFLVRMTGFEPTRLSTLEPETSASAVPPHPHIKLKIESGKLKII